MENANLFKVLIVGGGLGGLCLAQGLKKVGIACRIFERDASPTSRLQGYRLSMNPAGLEALHANLPPPVWQAVEAALVEQIEGISFVREQLEPRFFKKTPDPVDSVHRFGSISRVLGDAIHSMPPTSGEGANTALQDAAELCASLVAYQQGKLTLVKAIGDYEEAMLAYAFKAVANATTNLRRMVVRESR